MKLVPVVKKSNSDNLKELFEVMQLVGMGMTRDEAEDAIFETSQTQEEECSYWVVHPKNGKKENIGVYSSRYYAEEVYEQLVESGDMESGMVLCREVE